MESESVAGILSRGFKRPRFLPGLIAGILVGLLLMFSLNRQARAPSDPKPVATPFDITRLSPAELETLALKTLTALQEKRGPRDRSGFNPLKGALNPPESEQKQIRLGISNVKRLLPMGKKLTLESLNEIIRNTDLSREKRLLTSVNRIVIDPQLSGTAEVRESDLSVIHISPDYAFYLISDDEAMLLLGHELTHVALRTGRLKRLIEKVNEAARTSAGLELDEYQQEELACEYVGAEVLKLYIALYPTAEPGAERFSRTFGYEPPAQRLARAWQDFCVSYNGAPLDEDHLSWYHTFGALVELNPELKNFIPADAFSTPLCR